MGGPPLLLLLADCPVPVVAPGPPSPGSYLPPAPPVGGSPVSSLLSEQAKGVTTKAAAQAKRAIVDAFINAHQGFGGQGRALGIRTLKLSASMEIAAPGARWIAAEVR